jgi:hypothetical protein
MASHIGLCLIGYFIMYYRLGKFNVVKKANCELSHKLKMDNEGVLELEKLDNPLIFGLVEVDGVPKALVEDVMFLTYKYNKTLDNKTHKHSHTIEHKI